MGYHASNKGDKVEIPHELCRPLRILGDLHFEEDESPRNVEIDQKPSIPDHYGEDLSQEDEARLREYIETHPRLTDKKEGELTEDLDRLTANTDIQWDTQTEQKAGKGPAEKLDIDADEYFGDEAILDPEIEEIIRGNEPVGVDGDIPERIEEEIEQTERKEYYQSVVEVPGHRESLKEFEAHSRNISSIEPEGDSLKYQLENVEHPEEGEWFFTVRDSRRSDSHDPDLHFTFMILADGEPTIFKHEIHIEDGQFVCWRIKAGEEYITETINGIPGVSGAIFHTLLHDRSHLLKTIEEFVNGLENADINPPAKWAELD
jgi:hypothetical protein